MGGKLSIVRVVGPVLGALAFAGWAAVGAYLFVLANFATADTRCGEFTRTPRIDAEGVSWVLGYGLVWIAPFLVLLLIFRNRLTLILTGIPIVVAAVAVVFLLTHPWSFCF
ncbi:hypothetical protein [Nocardia huaxiensis]|uniref:Uncharacterized protein n=1 Tax=Nocardia huaxiensis TaxID=2755382 RepID=A0A7D6Z641_9NOCA|nr:hypothetical protein [Nocardia huaxiensis]QLY27688.1 hypothetical protein H0264_19675 [Nocardia huaxiensis]UFS98923.1 hypothetical protein LPY97_14025 [Nocardia huaxiensis]